MEKEQLFDNIYCAIEEAYTNLSNDIFIKNKYLENKNDFDSDLLVLKKILDDELSYCRDNICKKEIYSSITNEIKIISDKGSNTKHDLFVFLPIFNATDDQAVRCIFSVLDNFSGLDYQFLIMTNRELDVFENEMFMGISHVVLMKDTFSLPECYNNLFYYAKKNSKSEDSIIVLMDDDAYILTGQSEKVIDCINRLKYDEYVASSGHYYDITPPQSFFQQMVNVSHVFTFVDKYKKPYCHGGACFMIKIKNFPILTTKGLGGISVNILAFQKFLKQNDFFCDYDNWCLYNDTTFKVFHPRKNNLFAWIATYLSYEIAWKNAMDLLDKETYNILKNKLVCCSTNRIEGLYEGLKCKDNSFLYLGNLYLTKYLKPILKNHLVYSDFKKYKISTHINLD